MVTGDETPIVEGPVWRALDLLLKNWWMVALRGLAALMLGVFALAMPAGALRLLIAYFAVFALVHGIMSFAAAIQSARTDRAWGLMVIEGLFAIAAAMIAFRMPVVTALSLTYLVAAWALGTGILQIIAAVKLRKLVDGEWFLGLSGALSVFFGLLAFSRPWSGALAVVTVLGVYAIIFGIANLMLGFRMGRAHRDIGSVPMRPRQVA
ncbi:MAG: HdeD family acid-resistance protein [Myxococcaceae bacterium]